MAEGTPQEPRSATQDRRRPPREPVRRVAAFEGDGALGDAIPEGPVVLVIEATGAEGDLALWFDDLWWTELIENWGNELVTLHIAPTLDALLHPIVLYQLEMIHRVTPRWSIVGHAYRNDVITPDAIETLAGSPYHEVRFFDMVRPAGACPARIAAGFTLGELFGEVRREQVRLATTKPVLVRLPASTTPPPTSTRTDASVAAVPDKQTDTVIKT